MKNVVKLPKHNKSALSEAAYITLNVGLAAMLLVAVLAVQSPLLALALVLLSKWRILAVRPHFCFKNIRSNLVDIIVGLSIVVLLHAANGALPLQVMITLFFAAWLLFIKPRSKRTYVAFQAGTATFLGITALFMVSYEWPGFLVVLLMWLIGYGAARHVLSHYHEPDRSLFAMLWAVIMAELGWLNYHWAFAYNLPGSADIQLSQTAIVAVALGFLADRIYDSYHHNEGVVRWNDVSLPALFSVSTILVIMLLFNTLGNNSA